MTLARLALLAVAGGLAGWALENLWARARGEPPRYSHMLGKERELPWLPVYAAGAVAVAVLAPRLGKLPAPLRAAVYAGALSGLELGACTLDRSAGSASWRYGGAPPASPELGGCVDVPHAIAWGALGLLAESVPGVDRA